MSIALGRYFQDNVFYIIHVLSAFIWSQEEPRNMGAWSFVKPRFENLCGRQVSCSCIIEIRMTSIKKQ